MAGGSPIFANKIPLFVRKIFQQLLKPCVEPLTTLREWVVLVVVAGGTRGGGAATGGISLCYLKNIEIKDTLFLQKQVLKTF